MTIPFKAALKCNFMYEPERWSEGINAAVACDIDSVSFGIRPSFMSSVKAGTKPIALTNIQLAISKGLKVGFQMILALYDDRYNMPTNTIKRAEFIADFKWVVDNWGSYITFIENEEPALGKPGTVKDTPAITAMKTAWLTTLHREMKAYIKLKAPTIKFTLNFPSNDEGNIAYNGFDYTTADNERIFDFYTTQSGNTAQTSSTDMQGLSRLIDTVNRWKARFVYTPVVGDPNLGTSQLEGLPECLAATVYHRAWQCVNQSFFEQVRYMMQQGMSMQIYHSVQLVRYNGSGYMSVVWPNIQWNATNGINPYDRLKKILESTVIPPTTGTLDLKSVPTGADVYLNNVLQGVTNLIIENIPPSVVHTVKIIKTGFQDIIDTILISPGLTLSKTYTLVPNCVPNWVCEPGNTGFEVDGCGHKQANPQCDPLPTKGSLDLKSVPAGAEIYLDSTNQGLTDVVLTDILEGPHEIKLLKSGYVDITDTVTIIAGQTVFKTYTLVQTPATKGTINFVSVPPGAIITANNTVLGTAPISIELVPGHYAVKASLGTFPDISDEFDIAAGETITKIYTFTEQKKSSITDLLVPIGFGIGLLSLLKK